MLRLTTSVGWRFSDERIETDIRAMGFLKVLRELGIADWALIEDRDGVADGLPTDMEDIPLN